MLSKTEMKMMQRYLERDVQPRIPEVYKCAAGIITVVAVALIGPMVGLESGRAADLVALIDGPILEHLVGLTF